MFEIGHLKTKKTRKQEKEPQNYLVVSTFIKRFISLGETVEVVKNFKTVVYLGKNYRSKVLVKSGVRIQKISLT